MRRGREKQRCDGRKRIAGIVLDIGTRVEKQGDKW